jgi:hypothetical protein
MTSDGIIGRGIRGCNSMFSNITGEIVLDGNAMKVSSTGGGLVMKNLP